MAKSTKEMIGYCPLHPLAGMTGCGRCLVCHRYGAELDMCEHCDDQPVEHINKHGEQVCADCACPCCPGCGEGLLPSWVGQQQT